SSWAAIIAPPRTRRTSPSAASRSRSLRTVTTETPNRSASACTLTNSWARMRLNMLCRRLAVLIRCSTVLLRQTSTLPGLLNLMATCVGEPVTVATHGPARPTGAADRQREPSVALVPVGRDRGGDLLHGRHLPPGPAEPPDGPGDAAPPAGRPPRRLVVPRPG